MPIKADRWIREMALNHGMIEPFVDGQVREGVISYGLTSYGYDMRVTNQFKVFTNVYNALVDPKNFNPRSFVDIEAEHIDIPPNSFALAQSFEYFRIPRTVSCITIGKSTYARCFSADTRVALVDGTAPTIEHMARRAEDGELFWGYSVGPHGRMIVTLLEAPRCIGQDSLLELVLDNGQPVRCTPDHEFLLRDGQLRAACDLRPGDALMPLYRELIRGYEVVYQPLNGHLLATHRLADEWGLRHGIYVAAPDPHRHHKDFDRRNHNPWNLERMDGREHIRMHNAENHGEAFDPELHGAAVKAAYARLRQDPAWYEHYRHQQAAKGQKFWRDERFIDAREERSATLRDGWTDGRREQLAERMRNHKVASIRDLGGNHDVYCLSVPEAGNFALEAGVFVRNCGIIINVTPLEPQWEGYVTIEISNTTPLPARIYANEGIGQVLFLESDEPCEVSYADKKGKYQGQQGIVLPRIDREG